MRSQVKYCRGLLPRQVFGFLSKGRGELCLFVALPPGPLGLGVMRFDRFNGCQFRERCLGRETVAVLIGLVVVRLNGLQPIPQRSETLKRLGQSHFGGFKFLLRRLVWRQPSHRGLDHLGLNVAEFLQEPLKFTFLFFGIEIAAGRHLTESVGVYLAVVIRQQKLILRAQLFQGTRF